MRNFWGKKLLICIGFAKNNCLSKNIMILGLELLNQFYFQLVLKYNKFKIKRKFKKTESLNWRIRYFDKSGGNI